jgi:hypothetical protein
VRFFLEGIPVECAVDTGFSGAVLVPYSLFESTGLASRILPEKYKLVMPDLREIPALSALEPNVRRSTDKGQNPRGPRREEEVGREGVSRRDRRDTGRPREKADDKIGWVLGMSGGTSGASPTRRDAAAGSTHPLHWQGTSPRRATSRILPSDQGGPCKSANLPFASIRSILDLISALSWA